MRRFVFGVLGYFVMSSAMMLAQSATPVATPPVNTNEPPSVAPPKGSVTGHVYLGDTGGPARFAMVLLKPVPDAASVAAATKSGDEMVNALASAMFGVDKKDLDKVKAAQKAPDPSQKAANAQMTNAMSVLSDLSHAATAGVDGAYTLTGVKPGTYYVHAVLNGYIDPLKAIPPDQLNNPDAAVQEHLRQELTTVTINGDEAAHFDLRLERGAAISGRVTYDDGSPAMGWDIKVIAVKKAADGSVTNDTDTGPDILDTIAKISHTTDDHGHYRFAGLNSGDYIVVASLAAGSPGGGGILGGQVKMSVMSGNVMSQKDAKPVSVIAGGDVGDVDLVMPLNQLHSISGKIAAKSDGHSINDANIYLVDDSAAVPPAIGSMPKASLQEDGSFRFDYVADGRYTVRVRQPEIVQRTGKTIKMLGMDMPNDKTLRSFENTEQKVVVSDADVTGVVIGLAEKAKEKDDDNK